MTGNVWGRRGGSRGPVSKIAISAGLVCLGTIFLLTGLKWQIGPNIDAVSRLKARGVVSGIIHETVREAFSQKDYENSLFRVVRDSSGKIQTVQANTPEINKLVSGIGKALQEKYDRMEPSEVRLNYGTLMGSKLLSQTDLGLDIRILPMAVTRCDFETAFEGQGINQTKYKVFVTMESSVRVMEPFSAENIKISSKMMVCEVVILGEVPDSYVNVPEEDILDVT